MGLVEITLFCRLWRHNSITQSRLYIKLGWYILSKHIFYMKIKSFYTLNDTCYSQKLQSNVKSDIDDVINTSKCRISLKTFLIIPTCLDDCIYRVSSPYKVLVLLAVVNMSEKTPLDLWGVVHLPLWGARETTFDKSEKRKNFNHRWPR